MKARVALALVFLIPGGLLLLAGVALCWPELRRMTAALGALGNPVFPPWLYGASRDSSEQATRYDS